jgi:hypothetical protein
LREISVKTMKKVYESKGGKQKTMAVGGLLCPRPLSPKKDRSHFFSPRADNKDCILKEVKGTL